MTADQRLCYDGRFTVSVKDRRGVKRRVLIDVVDLINKTASHYNHSRKKEKQITSQSIVRMLLITPARRYVQAHGSELIRDSRGRIDSLLNTVAGDVRFNQLMLSTLAHLEHKVPLSVDFTNHSSSAEDNGPRAGLS